MQEALKDFSEQMKALLWPDKYFAWQTLLMLSLFSWLVATVLTQVEDGNRIAVEILSTLSWVFLTSAIWWALHKNKDKFKVYGFSVSPWITGAVLCLFSFRPWEDDRLRWALSCWPLISVAIAALPDFVNWELKFSLPKKEKQQELVMILLINMLLTSWLLFYFRVQDWVRNYPSLLTNDLGRSAFVYDFAVDRKPSAQGVPLLESTADAIIGELTGQPWYQAERWLYNRKGRLEEIALRMNGNLAAPDEQIFWQVAVPEPQRLGEGYLLTLRADWTGPVSDEKRFFVEKACKIMPQDQIRSIPEGTSSETDTTSEENDSTPAQVSKITVVDCGEDSAKVQWTSDSGAAMRVAKLGSQGK